MFHHSLQVWSRSIQKQGLYGVPNEEKCYFTYKSVMRSNHDDVIMTSFNKAHHYPCSNTHGKFGQDPSRNTACMARQTKKSAILHRNQWCVATMMISSWRHSIGHITTHVPSLMASLVKIHPKNTACMPRQTKKSAILHGNQWCVATMMTSSWRHSIGHITRHVPSLIASLDKIHPETQPVCRAKRRKVWFYPEISDA